MGCIGFKIKLHSEPTRRARFSKEIFDKIIFCGAIRPFCGTVGTGSSSANADNADNGKSENKTASKT